MNYGICADCQRRDGDYCVSVNAGRRIKLKDPSWTTCSEKLVASSANTIQVGGSHYKDNTIQPWDFIVSNDLGFLEGNIVKYVVRWQKKGGVQDLEKASHYLAKLIEVAKSNEKKP